MLSSLRAQASYCSGISCRGQALGTGASVVEAHGLSSCDSWTLEQKVSNCGTQAKLLSGMWDLQGSGI